MAMAMAAAAAAAVVAAPANTSYIRAPFLVASTTSTSPSCHPLFTSYGQQQRSFLQLPSTRAFSSSDESTEAKAADKSNPLVEPESKETLGFQAETRQLLDIVTHSLYTDKEVFLRELVSNASDALEKLRHVQQVGSSDATVDPGVPLEIRIETDELNGTLTITDTGIGLTKEEMIENLGTIARSGSKAFMNEMSKSSETGGALDASRGIIGKFGVGFYSAFMVGDKVQVRSKSAYKKEEDKAPLVWSSEGVGSYDIGEVPSDVRQDRGASVVVHLKEENLEYSDEKRVESVLKKYSNFVNFPIYLNGNRVNTMEAVWALEPSKVDDDTYASFYKFIAHAYDDPLDKLHYRADAPLEIKALFYIPSFHSEKYGMGRMEPGVSLYSRKVLIESKSQDILPDWMRFVKGAVDSEDLPLSISREKPQDSALIAKLRKALTRKFISHLTTMAKKDPSKYKEEFYREYAFFLKEGVCQDFEFQEQLSKLLYFETSKTMSGELSSLDEYVSRCTPEQKEIYYLCAPSRELALESPYLEAFEKVGREVIFVYTAIDDFVMANLDKFGERPLISAEKGDIDLGKDDAEDDAEDKGESSKTETKLSESEATEFCAWMKQTLGDKISQCKVTNRLGASPAIVTDNESGALRRMMRMVDTNEGGNPDAMKLPPQQVEINPKHPLIAGINAMKDTEPALAKVCAEQVFDNCLVAAGLLDDGRSMLPRLQDILLCVVKGAEGRSSSRSSASSESVGKEGTEQ
mmetsp:Transcript_19296/g.38934  ORF Transcript_19296/g.38934 Transcript_19296/m.38934 type:complete len:749 (+) Transcript_19296:456-2702(+)